MTVSPGSTITAHFATLPDPHVPGLERFSQLVALCFSLLSKETDQATGPMIMKFALYTDTGGGGSL
jgi:hypothetical protein